jgi:hypothetical protein
MYRKFILFYFIFQISGACIYAVRLATKVLSAEFHIIEAKLDDKMMV